MFLRKAIQVLTLALVMHLCIGGLTLCQSSTSAPPFGDKHVGGDIPVGSLRISVGLANTLADVERGIDVIASAVGA